MLNQSYFIYQLIPIRLGFISKERESDQVYFLLGKKAVLKLVRDLVELADENYFVDSNQSLKKGLMGFYSMVQVEEPLPDPDLPLFCSDSDRSQALLRIYLRQGHGEGQKIEAQPMDTKTRQREESCIRRCLSAWSCMEPELAQVFEAVVHTLFFQVSKAYVGGSLSTALGVIWVNKQDHWGLEDWAEFLLHELTHQLLFLDSYRQEHFQDGDLVADRSWYALSALVGELRPFNFAFHNLIVAHEVLRYRSLSGGYPSSQVHPPTTQLSELAKVALDSLSDVDSRNKVLSRRGRTLLERVAQGIRRSQVTGN